MALAQDALICDIVGISPSYCTRLNWQSSTSAARDSRQ